MAAAAALGGWVPSHPTRCRFIRQLSPARLSYPSHPRVQVQVAGLAGTCACGWGGGSGKKATSLPSLLAHAEHRQQVVRMGTLSQGQGWVPGCSEGLCQAPMSK